MNNKPTEKIIIRKAQPGDINQIVELCIAHAAYEHAELNLTGFCERLSRAIHSDNPPLVVFVAAIGNMLAGYTALTGDFSTWQVNEFLHVDCMFVAESMRNRQIGKCLMDAVTRYARELEISEIQWQTPEWNADAIRFYHSMGAASKVKVRFVLKI